MTTRPLIGLTVAALAAVGSPLGEAGANEATAARAQQPLRDAPAQQVGIVAPRPDALVTGRALRVVVALGRGTARFRAWVDRREVTGRFRPRSGRRRAALIPRGLLRPGFNDVVIRTADRRRRDGFDSVRVIAGRRAPRLLSVRVRGAARRRATRISGTLRLRARLRPPLDRVRVHLNGRPVPAGLVGGSIRRGRLAADDGLRFGRNVVTITAWHDGGSFDRERQVVFVSRARPLPAAGRNRRVRTGARVRLDGRASRPRRKRERLSFVWRVLSRPQDARPRLVRQRSARPTFAPDRPGRYRLQLRVRSRRPGAATAAASAASATDVLDVCVQPDLPPVGAALDTHATVAGKPAISVGDQAVPYTPGRGLAVVLDRCTLQSAYVVGGLSVSPGQAGYGDYQQILSGILNRAQRNNESYLVILGVQPGVAAPLPDYTTSGFAAVTSIGPTSKPDPAKPDLVNVGGAVASDPNAQPDSPGAITGYLQLDNRERYALARPAKPAFESRQLTAIDQPLARIQVGSATWTSGILPGGGQAGFMMVALDRSSLRPVPPTPSVFPVNGGPEPDQALQAAVADQLRRFRDSGALVFVQSIGNPKPTSPAWAEIGSVIDSLGGSAHVFNTLDGTASYSLVGCRGCRWPVAREASNSMTRPHTEPDDPLNGRLSLDNTSSWGAWLSDLGGDFDYALADIMAQPPSSWPCGLGADNQPIQPPCSAGHQAALNWVTDRVLGDQTSDSSWCQPAHTFRNAYCSPGLPWNTTIVPRLRGAGPDALTCEDGTDADGDRFTKEDCQDVQRELLQEVGWRETVTGQFPLYKLPFTQTELAAYIGLQNISHTISDTFKGCVKDGKTAPCAVTGAATPSITEMFTETLDVLALFPFTEEVNVLEAFSSLTTAITKAGETTTDQNGAPTFDHLTVQADQLANEMVNRYDDLRSQLDRLERQVLSDYVKLKEVARLPALDETTVDDAGPKLRLAAAQWVWQRLLPKAYWMFKFRQPKAPRLNDLTCERTGGVVNTFNPFGPLSDNASWTPILGFDQNMGQQKPVWYAPGNGALIENLDPYPLPILDFAPAPGEIFDKLWRQPPDDTDPTLPGLYEPWFHERAEGTWQNFVDYSVGHFPGWGAYPNRPCWYGDESNPIEP